MISFKRLTSTHELLDFQAKALRHLDIVFPLSYLNQGRVYGVLDRRRRLIGGWVFITEEPYRTLSSLPDGADSRLPPTVREQTAEITALWLDSKLRRGFTSLRFWLQIYFETRKLERRYLIFAYNVEKKGLESLYSVFKPRVVFRGITRMLPGMGKPEFESIEYIARRHYLTGFIKIVFRKLKASILSTILTIPSHDTIQDLGLSTDSRTVKRVAPFTDGR